MAKESSNGNGKIALLTTLASSSDSWIKFAIIVLVGLSGLGNFWTTVHTSDDQKRLTVDEARELKGHIDAIYANQQTYMNDARRLNEMYDELNEIKLYFKRQQHPAGSDQQ
jgi:hypothetical protein